MRPASLVAAAALAVLPAVTAAQLLDTRATYYAVGNLGRYDLGEMRNAQTFTAPAATLNGVTFVGDFWFPVTLQVQAGDAHAPSGPSLFTQTVAPSVFNPPLTVGGQQATFRPPTPIALTVGQTYWFILSSSPDRYAAGPFWAIAYGPPGTGFDALDLYAGGRGYLITGPAGAPDVVEPFDFKGRSTDFVFVAAFGEAALPIIPFQVIPDPPDRPITTAPEPATLAIVGPGLLAVGIHARRRRRRAR